MIDTRRSLLSSRQPKSLTLYHMNEHTQKTLGQCSIPELIKNINALKDVLKLPGITESARQTFEDLIYCSKQVLKAKTEAI